MNLYHDLSHGHVPYLGLQSCHHLHYYYYLMNHYYGDLGYVRHYILVKTLSSCFGKSKSLDAGSSFYVLLNIIQVSNFCPIVLHYHVLIDNRHLFNTFFFRNLCYWYNGCKSLFYMFKGLQSKLVFISAKVVKFKHRLRWFWISNKTLRF